MSFRRKVARGLLLLAVGSTVFQTSGCDATTVRTAFLGSVEQVVTSLIGAFFEGLENQNIDFVTT